MERIVPWKAYSFRVEPYQRGSDVQKNNEEVKKLPFLQKNGGKSTNLSIPLKLLLECRLKKKYWRST